MKTYKITLVLTDEREEPEDILSDVKDIGACDGIEVISAEIKEVKEQENQ